MKKGIRKMIYNIQAEVQNSEVIGFTFEGKVSSQYDVDLSIKILEKLKGALEE